MRIKDTKISMTWLEALQFKVLLFITFKKKREREREHSSVFFFFNIFSKLCQCLNCTSPSVVMLILYFKRTQWSPRNTFLFFLLWLNRCTESVFKVLFLKYNSENMFVKMMQWCASTFCSHWHFESILAQFSRQCQFFSGYCQGCKN